MPRVAVAIALYTGVMLVFVVMDAIAKWIIDQHSIFQIAWVRFAVAAVIFAAIRSTRLSGGGRLRERPQIGWRVLRGICLLAASTCFYAGLAFIPLADAVTLVLTAPFMVALVGMVFLQERVRAAGWLAIGVGFLGALLIVRPGMGLVHWAAVLPLLAGLGFAGLQLVSRRLSQTGDEWGTLLVTAAVAAAALSPLGVVYWSPPTWLGATLMVMIGIISGFGDAVLLRAFRLANASTLAPYQYTQVLWAMLCGYLVFGEIPGTSSVCGAVLILGAGLYLLKTNIVIGSPRTAVS